MPVILSPGTVRQVADAIVDRAVVMQTEERLINNRKATGAIEYKERTEREEIVTYFYEYFDLLRGRMQFLDDRRQHQLPIHARAPRGKCISAQEAREIDNAKRDAAQQKFCIEQGKRDVAEDREKRKADMKRREEMQRKLREDMVGFRAAGVFLVAEEMRQRSILDNDYASHLIALRKRCSQEEVTTMKEVAAREAREERARLEVVNAAKKEAAALDEKRHAEVQKRQDKLIGKCTHARNGQSVFSGAYPKKLCLMCRIKLDPLTGLYVMMEGKGKK